MVGAVDDGRARGASLVCVEEEEAGGVGGEDLGGAGVGDTLVREDAFGDGEEGDARGRREVEGEVGGDARDGAEDDPGRRRRRRGGRHRHSRLRNGGGGGDGD